MAAARYIAISTPAGGQAGHADDLAADRRGHVADAGEWRGQRELEEATVEVSGAGPGSHADAGDGRQYRPEHAADIRAEEHARIGEAALHAEGRPHLLGEEIGRASCRERV